MERSTMVVVGVDGSADSCAALAHALDEAGRRRCWLRVVTAFEPALYPDLVEGELEGEVVHHTREVVNDVLARRRVGTGTAPISIVALAGSPGAALVGESEGTALLVVGHRGHGALASAVLGSVALHCVRNASCPVTVVPAVRRGTRTAPGTGSVAGAVSL